MDDQVDFFDAFKLIHLLGLFALLEQLNLFLGNLVRLLTEPLLLVYDVVNVAVGEAVSVVRLQLFTFDCDFGLSRQRQTLKTIDVSFEINILLSIFNTSLIIDSFHLLNSTSVKS